MPTKRLISISHLHPELTRGGAQQAAYELFKGFEARSDYDAYFLAALEHSAQPQLIRPRALIFPYDGRRSEFLMAVHRFDGFWQSNTGLHEAACYHPNPPTHQADWRQVVDFLRQLRPDIIHFNHTIHVGVEMLRAARMACPDARIVFTLHEFVPICHAHGHMMRRDGGGRCVKSSPSQCALCFPDRSPGEFFLRDRWLRAHFANVDYFVAPSRLLRDRFIAWGIPENKIVLIDYGRRLEGRSAPGAPPSSEMHNRFGFFGQLIDDKGIAVLIDAVELLVREGTEDFEVRIHGANLERASEKLQQKFQAAVNNIRQIKFLGSYSCLDVLGLAAKVDWCLVPSIWWENSPLVIQEAFMARRPVIASDIGGMAEKVRNGVDGLLFAVGDAQALAATMRRCLRESNLWAQLAAGIPEILTVEEAVELHRTLCFENPQANSSNRRLWEAGWAESIRALEPRE